jgi:hypothetical protein
MTPTEKYRIFCAEETSIPFFSRPWWLDAVCGVDNWNVVLVEKSGHICASLPYYQPRPNHLAMPPLTQTMGPWIRRSTAKYARQLAQQKDILTQLIDQLPAFDSFQQNFHYSISNWLPFYWKGFNQTTRYTYVLEKLVDPDAIWNGFLDNIRSDIRKARKIVSIKSDLNIEAFLDLNALTFQRQGRELPYNRDLVRRLDIACSEQHARRIFYAQDDDGLLHAAVYLVWDENSAYYLMGGGNPGLRNSGATSLCMWKAIQFASRVTRKFDFEGSMIESVERYFRAFGAKQIPYFSISKNNSKLAIMRQAAGMIKRSILKN